MDLDALTALLEAANAMGGGSSYSHTGAELLDFARHLDENGWTLVRKPTPVPEPEPMPAFFPGLPKTGVAYAPPNPDDEIPF